MNRSGLLARYDLLDELLVAHGFPPTSPWWRRELERFLRSGRRRWVLRVGRRGGKSSTLCRLAVVVALWGDWSVPPGDTGVVAIVSVDRYEAAKRIETIDAILNAVGVAHRKHGQEIDLPERRCSFSVRTCSTSGTIGFTSVMVWADEAAHWESAETSANPAQQVMSALRPTMATQPAAFEVMCSAPWGDEDYHHALMLEGDSEHQVTAHAATWEANPTITEADTHALEPDEREWSRAYAAIPGIAVNADWFALSLDRAMALPRVNEGFVTWVRYTLAIDPAFARDHFGWAVVSSRAATGCPRLTRVHAAGAWRVGSATPLQMAERVRDELCKPWGVGWQRGPEGQLVPTGLASYVYTDQFEGFSFTELARGAGLALQVVPWTSGTGEMSQIARYKAVRLAMLEGSLALPAVLHGPDGPIADGLASELRRVSSQLLPGGGERIVLPRSKTGGHMDSVSAAVMACSVALGVGAQEDLVSGTVEPAPRVWKQSEIARIDAKRRAEWNRDPAAAMRERMRRMG